MLTRENFTGPWAGLPVAWTDNDQFDETAYRGDVARVCQAGAPGVYTGGTTGEFYAMDFAEFQAIARATVEACHALGKPAMIGCTSTYTLGAERRAAYAAEIGADAIQVALPFWMEVGKRQITPFFHQVCEAAGGLPLSIYETTRAKVTFSLDQHRAIREAVPSYLMVKSNAGTLGATPAGCVALSEFVNVFVGEHLWPALGPLGARGACSSMIYWNPRICLAMWKQVEAGEWSALRDAHAPVEALFKFLHAEFGPRGYTDTAFDRLGALAGGFLQSSRRSRGPYPAVEENDIEVLRSWYAAHFPEMLAQ